MSDARIKKLFKSVFDSAQNVKAQELTSINLTKISSYADYVLIASGTSARHVQTITDHILQDAYKKCGVHPLGVEGYEHGQWVLADFGDVICHVFLDEYRPIYRLEHMWPRATPMNEAETAAFFKTKKVVLVKSRKNALQKEKVIVRRAKKQ